MAERERLTPAEAAVLLVHRMYPNHFSELVADKIPRFMLPPVFITLTPILQDAQQSQLLVEVMERVLDSLLPREKRILCLRYGWEDGQYRNLKQVAQEENVTRDRIKNMEAKAIRKLRHPSRSKILLPLLRILP